ncbi:hypothetical protein [Actinacidiphila acididurans]|uniref:DUF4232 domain-containing protein n=1 Tax=Actinacidiphila acididurans TaxID=2784346 RepID=A0ABS2U939_9ACTN|nr:hypothetical protein [Actinacidiphila acididurans]MBM9510683.1 hypothetical protein [Actinacidiphila acididurans]
MEHNNSPNSSPQSDGAPPGRPSELPHQPAAQSPSSGPEPAPATADRAAEPAGEPTAGPAAGSPPDPTETRRTDAAEAPAPVPDRDSSPGPAVGTGGAAPGSAVPDGSTAQRATAEGSASGSAGPTAESPAPGEPSTGPADERLPGKEPLDEETPSAERLGEDTPGEDLLDEELLRALMQNAVQGLDGSPDALAHIQRAIPARRQHRRQALAGAVAAVLLAGMAVPALLRAANTADSTDAAPQNVASSHAAAPGEDGHTSAWPGVGGPSAHVTTAPTAGPSTQPPTLGSDAPSAVTTSPTDTSSPAVPDCSSAQLGQGAGQLGTPEADGRTYGWFRLANVSTSSCTVTGSGVVQAVAAGSADPSRIQVLAHSAGDPATGLPPATAAGIPLVLAPGQDYEVDFAWVPAADGPGGCPVTPTSPPDTSTPTPTPTDTSSPSTADPGAGTGTGTTGNAPAPQDVTEAPTTTPSGSVVLSHIPATGAPVVTGPVIQNVCAGTVYTDAAVPVPAGASGS